MEIFCWLRGRAHDLHACALGLIFTIVNEKSKSTRSRSFSFSVLPSRVLNFVLWVVSLSRKVNVTLVIITKLWTVEGMWEEIHSAFTGRVNNFEGVLLFAFVQHSVHSLVRV